VAAEAALATLLLIEAGLLLKSFDSLRRVDAGFRAENLLTMEIELPANREAQIRAGGEFFTQVRERLATLPGVLAVTSGSRFPINGADIYGRGMPLRIQGRPNGGTPQMARAQTADADYFRTLGIPLIAGRVFRADDTTDAESVAIVNEAFGRQFFPQGGVIGQRIAIGAARSNDWMTVVGIAGDVKAASLDEQTLPLIYMPLAQHPSSMALAVRTAGDPLSRARDVARAVRSVDPEVAPAAMMTMEQRLARSVSRPRFESAVVGFFAGVALFLAAVGIFGVVAQATARRTKEIGIRMALGADGRRVVRHVLFGGMRPVAAGILLGAAGAVALRPLVASLLFHVRPADPWIMALAVGTLAAVAAVACLVPARRAARVDPSAALRAE
jgi:putative ABC transport system permease protein